jgi:hypothetical protein
MKKVFYLILTGIAMVILLAPGRGSETWQKITDCMNDLKAKAKNGFGDLVDAGKRMTEAGKKGVEKAGNEW